MSGGMGRGWRRAFWLHGPPGMHGPGGPFGPGRWPGPGSPPGPGEGGPEAGPGMGPFGGPRGPGAGGPRRGGPGGRFVEPFLLLLLAEGRSHGYDLLERLSQRGLVASEVDPGYLYRTLRGMEAQGLVTSEWDNTSRGPIKRTYALTAQGEQALHGWVAALREHQAALGRFLEAYAQRFPAGSGDTSRAAAARPAGEAK
jgi:PadR family transcriptional regulator PadR